MVQEEKIRKVLPRFPPSKLPAEPLPHIKIISKISFGPIVRLARSYLGKEGEIQLED